MEALEFEWGKAGARSRTPGVQFYNSFMFDGTYYALYDCIYMWKEGIPQPYIGKLVKIWERAHKFKKVKVQWFFRPSEISYYLGDAKVLENELFFASGKGVGVANINPLESIAGKCNVVCISKDSRNLQPSDEELCKADYFFYRIFDVDTFSISDNWADRAGELEDVRNDLGGKLNHNHPTMDLSKDRDSKFEEKLSSIGEVAIVGGLMKGFEVLERQPAKSLNIEMEDNESKERQLARLNIEVGDYESGDIYQNSKEGSVQIGSVKDSSVLAKRPHLDSESSPMKSRKVDQNSIEDRAKVGASEDSSVLVKHPYSDFESNPTKREKVDQNSMERRAKIGSSKDSSVLAKRPHLDSESNPMRRGKVDQNSMEGRAKGDASEDSSVPVKHPHSDFESNPIKSGKVDQNSMERRAKISSSKDSSVLAKHPHLASQSNPMKSGKDDQGDEFGKRGKHTYQNYKGERAKIGSTKDSSVLAKRPHLDSESNPMKKGKVNQDIEFGKTKSTTKFDANSISFDRSKSSSNLKSHAVEKPKKLVVSRRSNAEKNTWLILPWEDRMLTAQKQGTLILLQNLDPEYTSGEIEDIIWHAFSENCSAKMVQRTAFSSPFCGLALVILRSKEVVDKVLKRLCEDCLMLPNGRPLVGSLARLPKVSENHANFVGHLSVDKMKHKIQKEMKEAVSTSHYSQPNTIEFEMAMEWFLIQARSTMSWKKLYKKQADEMKELKSIFKSKQKPK